MRVLFVKPDIPCLFFNELGMTNARPWPLRFGHKLKLCDKYFKYLPLSPPQHRKKNPNWREADMCDHHTDNYTQLLHCDSVSVCVHSRETDRLSKWLIPSLNDRLLTSVLFHLLSSFISSPPLASISILLSSLPPSLHYFLFLSLPSSLCLHSVCFIPFHILFLPCPLLLFHPAFLVSIKSKCAFVSLWSLSVLSPPEHDV